MTGSLERDSCRPSPTMREAGFFIYVFDINRLCATTRYTDKKDAENVVYSTSFSRFTICSARGGMISRQMAMQCSTAR